MPDGLTIEADVDALVAALTAFGEDAGPAMLVVAFETGDAVAREARARLQRQLGPGATGLTLAGITVRKSYDGQGVVVLSEREPFPNVPLWLEKGTKRGHGKHANVARPYFYVSAELEQGPHLRRVEEALQALMQAKGLGD